MTTIGYGYPKFMISSSINCFVRLFDAVINRSLLLVVVLVQFKILDPV